MRTKALKDFQPNHRRKSLVRAQLTSVTNVALINYSTMEHTRRKAMGGLINKMNRRIHEQTEIR